MSDSPAVPVSQPSGPKELAAARVVTCIVPVGKGQQIADHLHRELGIDSIVFNHARGLGIGTGYRRRSGFHEEREVVSAIVPVESADEIFAALFHFAEMGQPHNGLIFMTYSRRAVPLRLPKIPEEEDT